ncbi:MAG: aminoglycoside phosphotransferase [Alphaproteobacteria bacterium]|nr:MAG: aminoglycoside phosphotransferase [Alphaproteobacteria bacterium]
MSRNTDTAQDAVFRFLEDPASHGIDTPVRRIDTHGAVLFLAGDRAYKVKRAVRYPYMDFSTLAKRKRACAAELALNRKHAPGLYRGLVPICRQAGRLRLGPPGRIVEWAVHMRRFDETMTLDHVAARGGLDATLVGTLARAVALSHAQAPVRTDFAFAAALARSIDDNRRALARHGDTFGRQRLAALHERAVQEQARLRPLLAARQAGGHVRHCHGDLHLRNLVLLDGKPVLFDALEFDAALATVDVLYDLAFLVMDMLVRGHDGAANLLFNRYLIESRTDAHRAALGAMGLFLSTRAGVRAKVACDLASVDAAQAPRAYADALLYIGLAERALARPPPRLIAIGGLSGSGKSTLAMHLAPHVGALPGAVHLRSDIVRKALFDCPEDQPLPPSAYAMDATRRVYRRLQEQAATVLGTGHSVIVDAVHQRPAERQAMHALAQRLGVGFAGLWLDAPLPTLVARVAQRRGDASDAGPAVVRAQAARRCGAIAWTRLDAGAAPADLLAQACAALDAPDAPTGVPQS